MSVISRDPLARQTPAWYDEAKLGIFIHWCPAAIPAYAPLSHDADLWDLPPDPDGVHKVWRRLPHAAMYQNALLIPGSPTARHQAERYGDLPYDAFVAEFGEEMIPACDPGAWADVCARSGARYVVLTTKLPDGFLLWPSVHRNPNKPGWQSKRDVVGEAAAAVRERGLRFGTYYCGGTDGTFGGIPMTDPESHRNAQPQSEEYHAYAIAHWREIVERYEPALLWNDFSFPGSREALRELLGWYVERVPDGVVNNRFQERSGTHMQPCSVYSDFITPEYSTEGSPGLKWEACRSVGLSFGYNALESNRTYMSSTELIHLFVDVVSRGGNLLLNISPTATGRVPWGEAERLLALGWWLREHGGSIYGTTPWDRHAGITNDGQGVRYTSSPDAVHAIVLGTPGDAAVEIDVLLEPHAEVRLPGRDAPLPWDATRAGVRVQLLETPPPRPAMSLTLSPRTAVRPA